MKNKMGHCCIIMIRYHIIISIFIASNNWERGKWIRKGGKSRRKGYEEGKRKPEHYQGERQLNGAEWNEWKGKNAKEPCYR